MKYFFTIFLLAAGLVINAQAESTRSYVTKNNQQLGMSIADMSSNGAIGFQGYFRYGYFVLDKLQLGLDVNTGIRDYNIAYISSGPFVKYHFSNKWFSPFAQASADFGYCDFTDKRPTSYETGSLTWNKYFVGAGIAMYVFNGWGFDVSAGYQQEYFNRSDDNQPSKNIEQWTLPIRWRVTYSF